MKRDPCFVFDTNFIVSAALIKTSVPRQALDMARTQGKLLLSWPTIAELQEVVSRKRFNKYVRENERMVFVAALVRDALLVEPEETVLYSSREAIRARAPKPTRFCRQQIKCTSKIKDKL